MKCLVDMNSKVSLLKESALDEVMPGWRTRLCSAEQNAYLVSITGDRLGVVACCKVLFKLGERSVAATFFICTERARLPVAGLTRQTILPKATVDLLLSRGASSIGGLKILILNWAGGDKTVDGRKDWYSIDGAPVRLADESVLPPLNECVLVVEVTSELAKGQFSVAETNLHQASGIANAYG